VARRKAPELSAETQTANAAGETGREKEKLANFGQYEIC
jgi:hypothetical protein